MNYITVSYIAYITDKFPNFELHKVNEREQDGILYEFNMDTQEHDKGYIVKSSAYYQILVDSYIIKELNESEFNLIKPFDLHGINNIFDWVKIAKDELHNTSENIEEDIQEFVLDFIDQFNDMLLSTNEIQFFGEPKYNSIHLNGISSDFLPMFHALIHKPKQMSEGEEHLYTLISTFTN
jgi:hypothetical protein